MLSSILVVGLMAAEAASPPPAQPAAVEISFVTRVGEGAAGGKRFMRDGCYQIESGGGTGGAGYARDSQAGCHLPAAVAPVFARLGAIPADALARDGAGRGGAAGGARAEGLSPGPQTRVVLIRPDGSRWVAANQATADEMLRAVNDLPSENQWYAKPPVQAIGTGGQLVVLAVAGKSTRTEAALATDGRWWCYRSVVGPRAGDPKLAAAKKTLALADAPARLRRILAGASVGARDEDKAPSAKRSDRDETLVEVAWPGLARSPLPRSLADTAADRFAAEMKALSPACAIAPAPGSR